MIEFYVENFGIAPKRKLGDAGFDFFVPYDFERKIMTKGEDILINTHIRSKLPEDYALIAFNKSGIATKLKLIVGACVVDSSYQGEIHIHVFSLNGGLVEINPGDKLIQFVPLKINNEEGTIIFQEDMILEDFYGKVSERGSGGFGSTGDKV